MNSKFPVWQDKLVKKYKFDAPVFITRPDLPVLSELDGYLAKIWSSGWVTNNGAYHGILENELAKYLKVKDISLFCNGTLALQIGINALGLKGEVITTPFTFAATPHVLYWNGIKPVFCDIEEDTYNIDVNKIEALITRETTAILPVHVFGVPCNVEKLASIGRKHGLKIVYDAAHSFGVRVRGVGIGNFGDAAMFSFHATKIFTTIEGGSLVCNERALKEKVDYLKNFGIKNEEEVVGPGTNAKMNEIQAAIGLIQLKKIDDEIKKRKALTGIYRRELTNVPGIIFSTDMDGVEHNYQYFVIRVVAKDYGAGRDALFDLLRKMNIIVRKYFYPLCSHYPCYSSLPSASPANLPVAERISGAVLSFPLYGRLPESTVKTICAIIKDICHENKKTG
ncbi:MAG: DegT/DnrJ/EryC1/StrS family aminotransferase [Candidatus Omnitrophota bacterium]|nr:DegT/DnrJ/EryC1/StrS family aminotransferase [Candidatus Omnitrophota bacterium]